MDRPRTPVASTQPLRVEATRAVETAGAPEPAAAGAPEPAETAQAAETAEAARAAEAAQAAEAAGAAPWVTVSRQREASAVQPPLSPRRVVTQVVGGLAAVLLVVGLLGSWAAQRLAEREAVTDAATIADVLAEAVITPSLTDALADGDPAAVAAMDTVVRERVLGPRIIRVKLWSPEGRVLYADEPQLVGRTFPLSEDQRIALSHPQTKAEVSALDSTENEFETGTRALEVYRPVWTPSGRELLFETYSPYDSVSERSSQLWRGFAGVTVSSLLMLVVLTAPILWRLLRRLGEAQRQREGLLERSLQASDAERRRIAGTLHDGPVQDLVASAFVAAGSAAMAESAGHPRMADDLRGLAASVRGNIRTLRTLLVDIYPPSLASSGLATALVDLAQSGASRGLTVQVDVEGADDLGLSQDQERLVHRVAQECLRNTAKHAAPCTATIRLGREDGAVVLDVLDDGPGFDASILGSPQEGHFGLRVLADLASDAGAVLQVASRPGAGTHWRLVMKPETAP